MRFSDLFEDEVAIARAILEGEDPEKKDKKKEKKDDEKPEDKKPEGDKEEKSDDDKGEKKEEGPKDDAKDDGAEEKDVSDDTKKDKEDSDEDRQDEKGEKNFGDKDGGKQGDPEDEDDDGDEGDEDEEEAPVTGSGPKTKVVIDPPLKQEKSEDEVKEEHLGFKKLEGKLSHEKGVTNPAGLAAAIGRKKYGKKEMEAKAHHKEKAEVSEGITAHLQKHDKVVDTLRKLRDRHEDRASKKSVEINHYASDIKANKADEFNTTRYAKSVARRKFHIDKARKYTDHLEKAGHKDEA